ncbi:hypothetical protein NQ318_015194 [Aromia moschata]|uniref:Uncharacterized protein n=1 Tax=Aromia moschata TaxID=1265417 RepID=A0AAV8XKL6_9CUCU|nr:hypothetical protein NQ318_015194 [Aromia moschata]
MKKTSFVDLEVKIPPYFSLTHNCTCNRRHKPACDCKTLNYMCSKMIVVEIPYKNSELIDAVRSMIKISTEEREFKFWNKLLDYPRGLHILRNRLKNSYISFDLPYVAVLTPTVKYRVHIAKGDVSFPKTVVFNNITSSGVFKLPIHWNSSTFPKEAFLTLTASNLNEIRRYRLIFEPPQEYIDLKY